MTELGPVDYMIVAFPGNMAELERLAELRNKGIVTPEEFEAKKKQILGI